MDAFTLALWAIRLGFVALVYGFFFVVVRALWQDLRSAVSSAASPLGRLVVLASPEGEPQVGTSIPLDAVTTLGRDINNTVVVDDGFVSSDHAMLAFRGRVWFLEDRGSTNGTFLNGQPVQGSVPMSYGDEIQLGGVRLRLERPPAPDRDGRHSR
jgi:pSer/pThr/pTyr-binding forkhead associated (FHA) protein